MTQGPAISPSGCPDPNSTGMQILLFFRGRRFDRLAGCSEAFRPILQSRSDEGAKQRMRLQRFGFELGVKLAAKVPRVLRQFADFDIHPIGCLTGEPKTVLGQYLLIIAVELISM